VASSRSRAAEGEHRKVVHCPPTIRAFYPSFFLKGLSQINDNQTNKLVWTDNGGLVPFTKNSSLSLSVFFSFSNRYYYATTTTPNKQQEVEICCSIKFKGHFCTNRPILKY
jgi:hypothetical protein